jgi:hypothetical protein
MTSVAGCKRDLGDCNLDGQTADGRAIPGPAAFDIASRVSDGLPMYEGQALVQSTCGDGTFCHAPAAVGANRIGVPAGLNFDVELACTDESLDPLCTQPIDSCEGGQTDTVYCQRLHRLRDNQNQINTWAEGMIQEIRAGAMPPGEAGLRAENPAPWLRKDGESLLPSIRSEEGQEIVRNWLACQSPVIARTEIATSPEDQLQPCASVDDEICVYSGPQGALPAPEWSEIYWSIMFTECVACHGPPNNNDDQNPNNPFGTRIPGGADPTGAAVEALDLSGLDKTNTSDWAGDSYPAVVPASAYSGGACATFGTLVVPGDSDNSLLLDKMRNNPPVCGTVMPPPGSIAEALIQVVEDWIDLGAPDN